MQRREPIPVDGSGGLAPTEASEAAWAVEQNLPGFGLPAGGKILPDPSIRLESPSHWHSPVASTTLGRSGVESGPLGLVPGSGALGAASTMQVIESSQSRGQASAGYNADPAMPPLAPITKADAGVMAKGSETIQGQSGVSLQLSGGSTELAQLQGLPSTAELRRSRSLSPAGNAGSETLAAAGNRLGGPAETSRSANGNTMALDLNLKGELEGSARAAQAAATSVAQSQMASTSLAAGLSVALPQATALTAPALAMTAGGAEEALTGTLQAAVNRQSAEAADAMQSQVQKFIAMRSSTPGHVTLQLHPRELGRLDMDFRQEGADLHVQITARETQTREMLESLLPRLKASLVELGINVSKFDIDGGDRNGGRNASDAAASDESGREHDDRDVAENNLASSEAHDGVFDPEQPGQLHITV